jgi:predicted MPP superfamily phosphohydrolase
MLPPNVDLLLAGHTHGGQIQIFGWPQFKKLDSQYLRGRFQNPGGQQMLVSAGIGTSIVPIRLGTQGEMVVVELQPPGRNSGTDR